MKMNYYLQHTNNEKNNGELKLSNNGVKGTFDTIVVELPTPHFFLVFKSRCLLDGLFITFLAFYS